MNKAAAMARLGLSGTEDVNAITRAYGDRLAQAQQQLVASQTSEGRQQTQLRVTELVTAYEVMTCVRDNTLVAPDNATVIRTAGEVDSLADEAARTLPPNPGMVLAGRLEIGAMLGHGGMGNVYAAHDRLKNEDVAIKVLRQGLSFSAAAKERFLAEAKLSCSLSHPNIVRVHDVGISGGHYYFSMERLEGQTLRQYMQSSQRVGRKLRLDEVLGMVRQLVEALEYAHRYIVHRDLKPENIWLADDGTVKLMDFGIARAYSHSQVTKTGMTLGTAYYMAPEQQHAAQEVDWRADQYSLGVVLYEMLSGTVPMGAATALGKLRPDLPRRTAQAIMRAMAPRPLDRWPSLDEFSHALHTMPSSAGKIAAAALLGVAALAAGKHTYDMRPQPGLAPMALVEPALALNLLPIVAPAPTVTVEALLPEPVLGEVVTSYEEAVTAASLRKPQIAESEIIESELSIEPEPLQRAMVQQPSYAPPTVREHARREVRELPPPPRFDPRLRPPPRGTRPPFPDPRRPPRR